MEFEDAIGEIKIHETLYLGICKIYETTQYCSFERIIKIHETKFWREERKMQGVPQQQQLEGGPQGGGQVEEKWMKNKSSLGRGNGSWFSFLGC